MEEMDNFERVIKKRLEEKESPVSDRVWKNIKSSLPPEDKKKPFRPLYFIIGSIVVISGFLYANEYYISEKSSFENIALESSSASTNEFFTKDEEDHLKESKSDKEINEIQKEHLFSRKNGKVESTTENKYLDNSSGKNLNTITKKAYLNVNRHSSISKDVAKRESDINKNRSISKSDNYLSLSSSSKNYNNINEGNKKQEIPVLAYSSKKLDVNEDRKAQENHGKNSLGKEEKKSSQTVTTFNQLNKEDKNNINDISLNNGLHDEEKEYPSSSLKSQNIITTTLNDADDRKENTDNNFSIQPSKVNKSLEFKNGTTNNSSEEREENKPNVIQEDTSKTETVVGKKKLDEVKKDSLEKEVLKAEQNIEAEQKAKKNKKDFTIPKIGLEVFLTPTLSKSHLSENVIQNDIDKDKAKISLGAGMRMNVNISERFRTGIGLSYSSYGDRSVIKASSDKDLLYVNYNIVQDSNGAWVYIPKDTIKFKKSFSSKQVAVNSFKYISIPIFAGYKILDGQFGLTVTGGLTANILTHAETNTYIMNSNSAVIINRESSKGENSPFRPLVFSVFVSPGISYKVNDNLRIILDPGFTWFLSSVYKSDYAVTRRILALECRTGVQFTLGK